MGNCVIKKKKGALTGHGGGDRGQKSGFFAATVELWRTLLLVDVVPEQNLDHQRGMDSTGQSNTMQIGRAEGQRTKGWTA